MLIMNNKIKLPRLAIVITTRCNLKCKLCSVGIPTQKDAYHIAMEDFEKQLGIIFSVIDSVDSLEFAGGEPFLHSDLPLMIEAYMRYKDRIKQWLVVTNGTILPGNDLIDALIKFNNFGKLHLSDYNINPDKTKQLVKLLDEIGFKYRIDKYYGDEQYQGGWVDPGQVISRNWSNEELCNIFANCGLVKNGGCWRLYKGKIHFCTRSARCIDEGFDFPSDYVDLLDNKTDIKGKSEKLNKIINAQYIMACDYCNGDLGTNDMSRRFPAAEQINT